MLIFMMSGIQIRMIDSYEFKDWFFLLLIFLASSNCIAQYKC